MQSAVASTTEIEPALPLRSHTILGVCEAIGHDFGFIPVFLRLVFAASVLWNPLLSVAAYFGLGVVVLASRLLFPDRRIAVDAPAQTVSAQSNDVGVVEKVPLAA